MSAILLEQLPCLYFSTGHALMVYTEKIIKEISMFHMESMYDQTFVTSKL